MNLMPVFFGDLIFTGIRSGLFLLIFSSIVSNSEFFFIFYVEYFFLYGMNGIFLFVQKMV